jgi:hypothetical protein
MPKPTSSGAQEGEPMYVVTSPTGTNHMHPSKQLAAIKLRGETRKQVSRRTLR